MENGHENIVRMLVGAGTGVIGGGSVAILGAMCRASMRRMARILDVLLGVEGEAMKEHWARQVAGNIPILHHAVMHGSLTTVHVCLAAGADENFVNSTGLKATHVVGIYAPPNTKNPDELKAAIVRMLQRGPAFRAQSWAWPLVMGGASVDASSATVLPTSRKPKSLSGVRVFRPKKDTFFKTRFAR